MKVVRSCALVNLVLLVTISAIVGNKDLDLTEFAEGLSDDSRVIFNSLNPEAKKKYYDVKKTLQSAIDELSKVKGQKDILQQQNDIIQQQKGELEKKIIDKEDKEDYISFSCAVDNIKSNTDLIYPQYTGKDKRKSYKLFTSDSECKLTKSIVETINAFFSMENELPIASHHIAHIQIPRFFCDMYAFLTRFDDDAYGHFLQAESHGHAETIIEKITESKLNGCQKEQAIIDFACRYARIRHGVNLYFHHFRSVISAKTEEISENKRRAISSRTNTEPDESQISVTLPEVLDYIGFLTAWNFTIDDLTFMNIVSETARPSNDRIYLPYYYDVKDGSGKTLKGVLPHANEKVCPLTPRASTTTDPNKRNR